MRQRQMQPGIARRRRKKGPRRLLLLRGLRLLRPDGAQVIVRGRIQAGAGATAADERKGGVAGVSVGRKKMRIDQMGDAVRR